MKDKDSKILEEAYNKINERGDKPGPYDYPSWEEDKWERPEQASKPKTGVVYVQDETSSRPMTVYVKANDDDTISIKFGNGNFSLSHATKESIINLVKTIEGIL